MGDGMDHETWITQLDDYVDGTLSDAQRATLQSHLDQCESCTTEVESLRKLLAAARQLSPAVPLRRDLWPELSGRLSSAAERTPDESGRSAHRRAFSPAPAWFAAAAVVILLAATVWIWQGRQEPAEPASLATAPSPIATTGRDPALAGEMVQTVVAAFERECMAAGQMLQASFAAGDHAGNAGADGGEILAKTLASGLLVLDDSIAETLAALEQDPDNASLMKLLMLRYQQKLSLLHGAIEIVEEV